MQLLTVSSCLQAEEVERCAAQKTQPSVRTRGLLIAGLLASRHFSPSRHTFFALSPQRLGQPEPALAQPLPLRPGCLRRNRCPTSLPVPHRGICLVRLALCQSASLVATNPVALCMGPHQRQRRSICHLPTHSLKRACREEPKKHHSSSMARPAGKARDKESSLPQRRAIGSRPRGGSREKRVTPPSARGASCIMAAIPLWA